MLILGLILLGIIAVSVMGYGIYLISRKISLKSFLKSNPGHKNLIDSLNKLMAKDYSHNDWMKYYKSQDYNAEKMSMYYYFTPNEISELSVRFLEKCSYFSDGCHIMYKGGYLNSVTPKVVCDEIIRIIQSKLYKINKEKDLEFKKTHQSQIDNNLKNIDIDSYIPAKETNISPVTIGIVKSLNGNSTNISVTSNPTDHTFMGVQDFLAHEKKLESKPAPKEISDGKKEYPKAEENKQEDSKDGKYDGLEI